MKRAAVLLLGALMLAPGVALAAPDDPFYPVQWGLSQIEAARAWGVSEGAGVVIAVVDTGVDATHPDLKGRVNVGYDFVDDDTDASDRNGHGTMIAGIIAATTRNGIGIASVAPRARILPVRVLDADGTGSSQDVARGIRWAVDQGAHVINLSLAQDGPAGGGLLGGDLLRDPSVGDAIEDAARAGRVVVVAAGNERGGGKAETAYDATVPGSLVVGATTPEDRRAAYSNYGRGLDLVAPGGGSRSDPSLSGCTQDNSIVSTWWDPKDKRSKYGGGCGTSMSVAFVSGVAAMLRAQGKSGPAAADRILATADDIGSPGADSQTGAGRLNAARALGAPKKKRSSSTPSSPTPAATPRARSGTVTAAGELEKATGKLTPERGAPAEPTVETMPSGSSTPPPIPSLRPDRSEQVLGAPLGSPGDDAPRRKGWPVTVASMLVSLLVLAHASRFVRAGATR